VSLREINVILRGDGRERKRGGRTTGLKTVTKANLRTREVVALFIRTRPIEK